VLLFVRTDRLDLDDRRACSRWRSDSRRRDEVSEYNRATATPVSAECECERLVAVRRGVSAGVKSVEELSAGVNSVGGQVEERGRSDSDATVEALVGLLLESGRQADKRSCVHPGIRWAWSRNLFSSSITEIPPGLS
jgi:hypothetical protein